MTSLLYNKTSMYTVNNVFDEGYLTSSLDTIFGYISENRRRDSKRSEPALELKVDSTIYLSKISNSFYICVISNFHFLQPT